MLEKATIAKINYFALDEFMELASAKIGRECKIISDISLIFSIDIEDFDVKFYSCDKGKISPIDKLKRSNVKIKLINCDHFIGILNGKRLPLYVRGIKYYKAFNSYYIAILDEIKKNILLENIDNASDYILAIYKSALMARFGRSKIASANYDINVCVGKIPNIGNNTINVAFKTQEDMFNFYSGRLSLEFAENREITIACNVDIKEEIKKIMRETNICMFM